MAAAILTVERLRELVHFDPETGIFTRRVRTAQRHQVGDRADFLITRGPNAGYYRVSIDSQRFMAHRVAWLHVHGRWPDHDIDHIDGNRGNNQLSNLRDVRNVVNRENMRGPRADNSCGYLGVVFHAQSNRWRARIQSHGRTSHLGMFDTPQQAHEAYVLAKRRIHEGCTI